MSRPVCFMALATLATFPSAALAENLGAPDAKTVCVPLTVEEIDFVSSAIDTALGAMPGGRRLPLAGQSYMIWQRLEQAKKVKPAEAAEPR
jgi:hypothetical protein